jgi:glutamate synthase (ferredoxin)
MAQLGFRTVEEMVGRSDRLAMNESVQHWKAKHLDFSNLFYQPDVDEDEDVTQTCRVQQDHGLESTLDAQVLLDLCRPALERGEAVRAELPIRNIHRTVGVRLGSEVTRCYGADGLPADTIRLTFKGSAGQSFGAFIPKGLSLILEGDSNDYIGKGLSGGRIIVYPPAGSTFVAEDNIIIGNVAFYGATGGEAYIRGRAGERFCVRNSGMEAVVEGVGDHGCEYMTGGRVIVLGHTGRNFAAGMSGGIAYVFDERDEMSMKCNMDMVSLQPLTEPDEIEYVRGMLQRHLESTGSSFAQRILANWEEGLPKFVCIVPKDYERMLKLFKEVESSGLSGEEALMAAFELNKSDVHRVSGN